MSKTVENYFAVPKAQWNKWSDDARRVFNGTYNAAHDQGLFAHAEAKRVPAQHWETTRWNFAWWAADEVRHIEKDQRKAA